MIEVDALQLIVLLLAALLWGVRIGEWIEKREQKRKAREYEEFAKLWNEGMRKNG